MIDLSIAYSFLISLVFISKPFLLFFYNFLIYKNQNELYFLLTSSFSFYLNNSYFSVLKSAQLSRNKVRSQVQHINVIGWLPLNKFDWLKSSMLHEHSMLHELVSLKLDQKIIMSSILGQVL